MTWSRLYGSGDPDFWNRKDPTAWSSDEIQQLTTRSPWAKPVTAEFSSSEGGGSGAGSRTGGRGRRGLGGGMGGPGRAQQYKGTVRWESAKPVLEAMKTKLPESMANHYVISVSGFPMSSQQDDLTDRLQAFTDLKPKTQDSAQPGIILRQHGNGGDSLLFGFSKDILLLTPDDKEVIFSTTLGRLAIKAKFDLKEMMYRGVLAL
jgi:hypothetical protein